MYIPLFIISTAALTAFFVIFLFRLFKKREQRSVSVFRYLGGYLKLIYSLFFCFIIFFFFIASYKIFTPDSHIKSLDFLTEDVDYTGLTIGFIGIIVGLITVIYVEKQNAENERKVKSALDDLSSATRNINNTSSEIQLRVDRLQKITQNIYGSVANLKELNRVSDILKKISHIITQANKRGTIYICYLTWQILETFLLKMQR